MSTKSLHVWCISVLLANTACAPTASTAPLRSAQTGEAVASPFRNAAFVVDISTARRTVKVAAPSASAYAMTSAPMLMSSEGNGSFSLLGGDAVEVIASNYAAGVIGATVPGKVHVTFDLVIVNRLRGLRLVTPTFPLPPAQVTGIQAFPLEIVTLTTAGSVSSASGAVTVAAPRAGAATASAEWDGPPHSFFNDGTCNRAFTDCFRYEPFGALDPQSASVSRRVGFLLDPTVGDIRVRVIVAADLQSPTR